MNVSQFWRRRTGPRCDRPLPCSGIVYRSWPMVEHHIVDLMAVKNGSAVETTEKAPGHTLSSASEINHEKTTPLNGGRWIKDANVDLLIGPSGLATLKLDFGDIDEWGNDPI